MCGAAEDGEEEAAVPSEEWCKNCRRMSRERRWCVEWEYSVCLKMNIFSLCVCVCLGTRCIFRVYPYNRT